jgi:predicted site-specific integrase-resolvase
MKNEKEEKRFISVGKASNLTGLDPQTIRKFFDSEKISGYKTPSNQRKIDRNSIQELCNNLVDDKKKQKSKKDNFIYTRVSTKKQVDDLSRQIEYVRRSEYADYILIQDIGSGINFKRKGLSTILDSCVQRTIGEVVVAHRDRLCRFGFELIEQLITKAGGKITVLENNKIATPQEELADDLLSIIHIFSCRQMGRRSYSRIKQTENCDDKDKTNQDTD